MNKKTMKIAGWALGLSLAVAGIGAAIGTSAKGAVETKAATEIVEGTETVTFVSGSQTTPTISSDDGIFGCSFAKNDGSTAPAWNNSDAGVRLYPKGTLTISKAIENDISYSITGVSISWKPNKNSKNVYPTGVSINGTGTVTTDYSTSGTSYVVTGLSLSEFVLTVNGTAGNIAFKSLSISYSYEKEVSAVDTLSVKEGDYGVYIGKTLNLANCVTALGPNADSLRFSVSEGSSFASIAGDTLTGLAAGTATVKADYSTGTVDPVYFDVVVSEKPYAPTWKKVSGRTDYTGLYLLVSGTAALDGSVALGDSNSGNQFAVTVEDDEIEGDYASKAFFIEKTESGYSLKSAHGEYFGASATGKFTSSEDPWDIAFDGSIMTCSTFTLRYNSSHFRFYTNSGQGSAVDFYRLDQTKFVNEWVSSSLKFEEIPDNAANAQRATSSCTGPSGYYLTAKAALKTTEDSHFGAIADFVAGQTTTYAAAYSRYTAWASLNHDGAPFDGNATIVTPSGVLSAGYAISSNNVLPLVVTVAILGAAGAAGFFLFQRKRKEN